MREARLQTLALAQRARPTWAHPRRVSAAGLALVTALTLVGSRAAAQDREIVRTTALDSQRQLPRAELAEEDEASAEDAAPEEDVIEGLGNVFEQIGRGMDPDAQGGRVRWDPRWPRYRADELVLTAGMGLVFLLAEFLPTRSDSNWSSASDFDIAVQRGLGAQDPNTRAGLALASDVLLTSLILWPLVIDSILHAGVGENAWDVAWQISLISLEVFAINQALNIGVKLLSRRERPIGVNCRERPGYANDPVCADPPPAESFWSGHVSNAFAGAALVCLHHDVLDLFGDAGADGAACGAALTMASATGLFRIMSDRHWVTDVLAGAVVGSLIGVLVPWVLHYQGGARSPLGGSAPPLAFAPMLDENTMGVSAFGLW